MPPQVEWTNKFLASSTHESVVAVSALATWSWWKNPLNPYSLRLSSSAFAWITKRSDIKGYKIELHDDMTGKQMLQLERVFKSPYFITAKSITVFSEEDAIMLQLHAGNLKQYLDNLSL